jgi:hypothetical protein
MPPEELLERELKRSITPTTYTKTGAAEETEPNRANEGGSPKTPGKKRPSTNTVKASNRGVKSGGLWTRRGAGTNKRSKASSGKKNKGVATLDERAPGTDTTTSTIPEDDYKRKIAESTKILTELFRLDVQSESHPADDKRIHWFPGPRGQEVRGAQPFFGCLLDAIGLVAEKWHVQKYSPKRGTESTHSDSNPETRTLPPVHRIERQKVK